MRYSSTQKTMRLQRKSLVYDDLVYLDVDPYMVVEQEDLGSSSTLDQELQYLDLFNLIVRLEELVMEELRL